MKEQPMYHIDTTQEEDALFQEHTSETVLPKNTLKKGTFTKIFCAVFGIHVLGAGLISLCSSSANASSTTDLKKPPEQEPVAQSSPTPTETPAVPSLPLPAAQPNKPVANKTTQKKQEHKKPEAAKGYVVKQGDTISSIAKKYKLSPKRLLQINNIKDINKIKVGQVLKFM